MQVTGQQFTKRFLLRFHMSIILCGIIAVSVACNNLLLRCDIDSMFLRYPLNVVVAYGAFFVFIRIWLLYVHRQYGSEVSQLDSSTFQKQNSIDSRRDTGLDNLDVFNSGSFDDCGCFIFVLIIVIVVLLFGGFLLVFEAPVFLTEVAASFFLAGSLSKPARKMEDQGWTDSIFRQTWKRFVLTLILAVVLAWGVQIGCPQSHTIMEALKHCL